MAGGIKYKDPKIVRAKKGWFVGLYYEYPDQAGKYKRFEISAGINYIHDLQEREKEAQILLKEVKLALQAGFDPFMTHLENEFIESIAQKVEAIKKVEAAEAEAEAGNHASEVTEEKIFEFLNQEFDEEEWSPEPTTTTCGFSPLCSPG